MEGILPKEIIRKKKHGMGLPIARWFKKEPNLHEMLNYTLFTGTPQISKYVRKEFLNGMKSAFETDTTSYYGDSLWVFLLLEQWLRKQ